MRAGLWRGFAGMSPIVGVAALLAAANAAQAGGIATRLVMLRQPPTAVPPPPPEQVEAIGARRQELRDVEDSRVDRSEDLFGKGADQRDNRRPPPNNSKVTDFSYEEEREAMQGLVKTLEGDRSSLEKEAAQRQNQLLDWMLQYASSQDLIAKTKTLADAKVPSLASLGKRRAAMKAELARETSAWEMEKTELGERKVAQESRVAELEKCIAARKEKPPPPEKCGPDGHGEAELVVALQQDAAFLDSAMERAPWELRRLQRALKELDDEEKALNAGSVWFQRGARLQKNQETLLTFSDILSTMEGYFDYRHTHTLAELTAQKDLLCELEIQPALIAYGLIDKDPDFTPVSMLVDETSMLHSAMEWQREYYHHEQRHLWRSAWMLRASLEDVLEPHKAQDKECESNFGKDWWTWAWCREAHMRLLRYFDDVPETLQDRMTGLSDVHRDMKQHISAVEEQVVAEDDPAIKAYFSTEITQTKIFVEAVVKELEAANQRLDRQKKFAKWLHWAQGIPSGDALKANMTEKLQGYLVLVEQEIKQTSQHSMQFQVQQANRIVECVERKCTRMQEHFYKGISHTAVVNKLAYEAMMNATLVMQNASRLEGLYAHINTPEHARRLRRLQSRVKQQLQERWRV